VLLVFALLYPYARVAIPMRNRIPRELDRLTPHIADLATFIVKEAVSAMRRH